MHPEMSEITRKEVLIRMRRRYASAGLEYKGKLIDEAVELFGYHRNRKPLVQRRSHMKAAALRFSCGSVHKGPVKLGAATVNGIMA